MTLEEEFEQVMEYNLYELYTDVIIAYVIKCFYSLSDFIAEKTNKSIHFTYAFTDKILFGLYDIGVENCKKEYEHFQSILNFQKQADIDYKLMKQIREQYFQLYRLSNSAIFKINDPEIKDSLKKDMEFYIKKYKFYNSFKITLS